MSQEVSGWSMAQSSRPMTLQQDSKCECVQAQEAAAGREVAEGRQAAAEADLQDARLHMDWQDLRIADLEGRDVSQLASRCACWS